MLAQCEYLTYTPLGGREIAQFFGRHMGGSSLCLSHLCGTSHGTRAVAFHLRIIFSKSKYVNEACGAIIALFVGDWKCNGVHPGVRMRALVPGLY